MRTDGVLAGLALAALLGGPGALGAQSGEGDTQAAPAAVPPARPSPPSYPLVPSSVLDVRRLGPGPGFSGYISVRETRRNDSTAFSLNRARLTLMAAPRPYVAFRLQAELSSAGRVSRDSTVTSTVLTDGYVQLGRPPRADSSASVRSWMAAAAPVLIAGQFRVPFSLEYLSPFSLLRTANRSAPVDRIAPRRDVGVMVQTEVTRFATVAAAVVAGEGPNVARNPDNRELVAGRLTLRPARALAVAGKWLGHGPDHAWGYDARWLPGRATVEGEVLHRTGRPPGATAAPVPSPRYAADGGYVLAAYQALPWLEPVVKWERLREDALAVRRETAVTAGATAHAADDRVRLQVNWVARRTNAGAPSPSPARSRELIAQLIAIY